MPSTSVHALSAAACAAAVLFSPTAGASSHREAPFITTAPKVDATDFYMFRSYEPGRQDYVTLVANYLPLQDGYGGPNYFALDPNALYEIHIDRDGDAREDLTFQFRFKNTLKSLALDIAGKQVAIPLIQSGGVSGINPATLNVRETYTVDIVRGDRRRGDRASLTGASSGVHEFDKPLDFVGTKTFGSVAAYETYVAQHVHAVKLPGCALPARVFVGQRKDPFVVNLGRTFDLLNLNPLAASGGTDDLDDKNVTTLALEVAASCLASPRDPVIGGWTSASLRQGRLLKAPASPGHQVGASLEGGPWAQVSRLGMPLVNEVVVGLPDKDRFNSSKPRDDGQFAQYVTHPTLPALIETLFKDAGVKAPTKFPRNDLMVAFLTGVPGLNQPAKVTAAEMLRLNTSIAAKPQGSQQPLGVLAGDNAGFPNGRRPGDDVVDAALRVSMGVLCTLNNPAVFGCASADAPSGGLALTDGGTQTSDARFDARFPYLTTPRPGAQ
ncbi:DUF4331 domain-containing protein [Caldimonas brevitalea]|uniref:DUF4331 domain-containing protein n=1 Tax=Caldimonas brevitalea TaxID=413882 RepID=A0A0G3BS20_9BURK|nr:DUF4331 domain-containing protein [Caldimonas brevitalea]AKJ30201.1 hypothetical protein AAW51_3510 [Caldimonas brevitalea]